MRVSVKIEVPDLLGLIEEALSGISEIDGIGADGTSEYQVVGVEVTGSDLSYEATFELERTQGKFASKDEAGEALETEVGNLTIDVPLEAS